MERFGYTGKLLRVDLESGEITIEQPDESYYAHYLGGRGLIMHTLLTEIPPNADPLWADKGCKDRPGCPQRDPGNILSNDGWDKNGVPTRACLAAIP